MIMPQTIANQPSYNADRQAINRAKAKIRPNYPPQPKKLVLNLEEHLENKIVLVWHLVKLRMLKID